MVGKKVNIITTNKTIVVDNLELNFKGDIYLKADYLLNKTFPLNQNCYIECLPLGSKMFNVIANLYIDDRLIGELRFSPRKGFFDSDLINFKYENVLLYSNDYIHYKDYLVEVLKWEYKGISHIEIAEDHIGSIVERFVKDYYHKTDPIFPISKQYQTRHKGKIKRKSINTSTMVYWGKITADKSIKVYNKTLELIQESPHKASYINHFWKLNGIPFENNTMERFEMSFRHLHAKMFDFDKLDDCNYLASILETHCKNYFDFEKKYRNHNKTYYKDVTPISFKEFHTIKLEKFKQEKQYTLKSEHTTVKSLYTLYLSLKYIASDIYVRNNIIQVPERLKDYTTILNTIDTILALFPSANQDFQLKKAGYEKEFEKENDLYNKRITIEDFVTAIAINSSILFETPDYSDPKYKLPFYTNLSPEQLKREQLFEYRMSIFNKKLDSIRLKKLEKDSDNLKKTNKVAIAKNDYNFKQSKFIRDLNSINPMEPIIEEELINEELLYEVSPDQNESVNIDSLKPNTEAMTVNVHKCTSAIDNLPSMFADAEMIQLMAEYEKQLINF